MPIRLSNVCVPNTRAIAPMPVVAVLLNSHRQLVCENIGGRQADKYVRKPVLSVPSTPQQPVHVVIFSDATSVKECSLRRRSIACKLHDDTTTSVVETCREICWPRPPSSRRGTQHVIERALA